MGETRAVHEFSEWGSQWSDAKNPGGPRLAELKDECRLAGTLPPVADIWEQRRVAGSVCGRLIAEILSAGRVGVG